MVADSKTLRGRLRDAGLSDAAISAAWPQWWSEGADATESGRAELRFALSRRLGLSPEALLGERVEFVWKDDARFKNLRADEDGHAAIVSFGVSLAGMLLRATPAVANIHGVAASTLRAAVLAGRQFVDLAGLISACWAMGIPIVHLRVFPLTAKSMHAMVVELDGRYAILLAKDSTYPAPVAFTLAHELGHAALGHARGTRAVVDLGDPATSANNDSDEDDADRYALELLTASDAPTIETNTDHFGGRGLAEAVLRVGPSRRIEPGTLALCVGYAKRDWPSAISSLRYIYREQKPVWKEVNAIAQGQLDWDALGSEARDYLVAVMGGRT